MANANFDTLLTTTLNNHRSAFTDGVFEARPLTHFLKKAGQIAMKPGGAKIVEPILAATNGTVGSFAGADTLNVTATEELTASEWEWAQYSVSVRITGIEEDKNNGPDAIIDMLQTKIDVAKQSAIAGMNAMFYGDGTGNSGKDWNGLANLIDSNAGVVGGIDASTDAYWESQVVAAGGATDLAALRKMFNDCSIGNDAPQFVLTTQDLFEDYEGLLQPNMRYEDKSVGEAGFQSLVFKGRPIVFDDDCPAGKLYFINPKYLKLVGNTRTWFKPTPFVRPTNQDLRIAQILSTGQFISNNRRMLGVITGATSIA